MEQNLGKSITNASLFIAIALVLAALIASITFYKIRLADNIISVTGSSKTSIVSDRVKWTTQIQRTVRSADIKLGYQQIADDAKEIKDFYASKGFSEEDYDLSTVSMDQDYSNNSQYIAPEEKQYVIRQVITLSSSEVDKVTNAAKSTLSLVNKGIFFSTIALEYSYSKLPELRVSLLADAVKDAKARATALAESSGTSVGSLRSASVGVVQVLSPDSADVSDYGTYDTSSIKKEVMVTVKANFSI